MYFISAEAPVSNADSLGHRSVELNLKEEPLTQILDIAFARTVRVKGRITTEVPQDLSDPQIVFTPLIPGTLQTTPVTVDGQFEIELEPGQYNAAVQDGTPQAVTIPERATNEPYELTLHN
jgi:hypothetical protein